MNAIADTGWIIAIANHSDKHHEWALDISYELEGPVLTCEAVLAEAAYKLRNSSAVVEMVGNGLLAVDFQLKENLGRIHELAAAYHDRKPDLADLCIIRMSEMFRQRTVLTVDAHDFKVYRRNRNEAIPFLAPS